MPGKRALLFAGGLIAIAGGLLIINSGYHTHSFLISVLNLAEQKFGARLPSTIQWITETSIAILGVVISLGGILVAVGGVIVILGHKFIGRILIGLGGGVSFLGLAVALAFAIYTSGFGTLVVHFEFWVGVLIATVGGYIAGKG